jgi:hypothetical protein
MQRQDYLERMLAQVADAIARAMGHSRGGRWEEAQRELDAIWSGPLGLRRGDVDRLDDATLRMLLGAKVQPAAALFEAQADLQDARGDAQSAVRLRDLARRMRG